MPRPLLLLAVAILLLGRPERRAVAVVGVACAAGVGLTKRKDETCP